VPCCLDSNGELELGNIFKTDLDIIMSSERAAAMKKGFESGKMVEEMCKKCTFARKFKIR
jgi:radical SAM protein with 4Fe4S-binding SPASM domain